MDAACNAEHLSLGTAQQAVCTGTGKEEKSPGYLVVDNSGTG